MRVRRIIGVVLALLALGGGGLWASRVTATHRDAARLEAAQHTRRVTGEVFEAVKALPNQLLPVAQSAASSKQLRSLISQDIELKTIDDFMRTEGGWASFRALGNTGLFFGDTLVAWTGAPAERQAEADIRQSVRLAHEAQATTSASGFLKGRDHPVLVSAAASVQSVTGLTTSVVIARALKVKDLEPLATQFAVGLSVATPAGNPVTAGAAPLVARLGRESDDEGTMSRELAEQVTLRVASDVSTVWAKAEHSAATSRAIAWVISALIAGAALAFAFWPRARTKVLEVAPTPRLEAPLAVPSNNDDLPFDATSKTQTSGRYQILGLLGEGGMAKVYVAVSRGAEGFQRSFVIKRLRAELSGNAEAVNQFIDEGRLGASLVHSNIVPVLDFGRDQDGYFLAQEYILGRSIDRLIHVSLERLGRPLSPAVVLYLAQEALKALAYAHAKTNDDGVPMKLVHRDVSPTNLMVSERGEVKLLDFGIVKSEQRLTKTQAGMVKGNLFYMSPEQAKGLGVDARSDLFSLGMVLLTASQGTAFYTGTTSYELINRAAAGLSPQELAQVRALPVLGPLLEKALQLDPSNRYASADEFARAVVAVATPATAGEVGALVQKLFAAELADETAMLREARRLA